MKHRISINYTSPSGSKTYTDEVEAELNTEVDVEVPALSTVEVDVAIDISTVRTLLLASDKTVNVKTNSSGAPQETIGLTAGVPIIVASDGFTGIVVGDVFAGDVTKLFVVNAGSSAANFSLRVLSDPTP
jgi:hypothetical protein